MEYPDESEGVNDWENIQPPHSATPNTAQWDYDDDMVVVRGAIPNDSSIFPPSNHEDLPVTPPYSHQLQEPPANPSSPSSSSSSTEGEREGELEVGSEVRSRVRVHLGILSSGIVRLAYGIRRYAACQAGVLSVTGVVVVLLAAVYGRRWLRWRRQVEVDSKDHLMLLIRQKDQKINQLLLQISRMNQILSAPRRVPVLRVVVDTRTLLIRDLKRKTQVVDA